MIILLLVVVDEGRPAGVERLYGRGSLKSFLHWSIRSDSRYLRHTDAPRIVLAHPLVGEAFDFPAVENVPGGLGESMFVVEIGWGVGGSLGLLESE